MAAAATHIHGKAGSLVVAQDTGYTAGVIGLTSWSLDIKANAADATGMDSGCDKEFIPGLTEWSGSCSGLYEAGTADGSAMKFRPGGLRTAGATNNAPFTGTFKMDATSTHNYSGTILITGLKTEAPVDGVCKFSMDFQGTGTLTHPST